MKGKFNQTPPPCSGCGRSLKLQFAQPPLCGACYYRARKAGTIRPVCPAAEHTKIEPTPTRCRHCGRPAHPVYRTCYSCGHGWPALPDAPPSTTPEVLPGRLTGGTERIY